MNRIIKTEPQRVTVMTEWKWPKCKICGFCHPDDIEKCPRIKSIDKTFRGTGK